MTFTNPLNLQDRIIHGKRGEKLSWFFFLDSDFWVGPNGICKRKKGKDQAPLKPVDDKSVYTPKISITKLRKTYASSVFGDVKALRGLTIDMYEGKAGAFSCV